MESEFSHEFGRMINRIQRRKKRFMTARLASKGLGGALYNYMLAINRHPGASQDFLVGYFCADKGNVARAVKKLEDEGYIRREPDSADRRQNRIFLTEKGEEGMQEIFTHLADWNRLLTVGFSDEELRNAHEVIARMEKNVTDALEGKQG